MRKIVIAAWMASLAMLLSGCGYWTEPQHLLIVDATTQRPIAGARVTAWPDHKSSSPRAFVSDAEGRVEIPSLTGLDWRLGDPGLAWPLELRIEADGYQTQTSEPGLYSAPQLTIALRPAPHTTP